MRDVLVVAERTVDVRVRPKGLCPVEETCKEEDGSKDFVRSLTRSTRRETLTSVVIVGEIVGDWSFHTIHDVDLLRSSEFGFFKWLS